MKRNTVVGHMVIGLLLVLGCAGPAPGQNDEALINDVLKTLNDGKAVKGTDEIKSYKILFDAYLQLTKPPVAVGPDFNLNTIHPKMSNWKAVSGWAESNAKMAQAILQCKSKNMIGLPYGRANVSPAYADAGVVAEFGAGGRLRNLPLPYQHAVDTIAAFATAELYRLMEAGQIQPGLDLAVAHCFVLRQFCDREFLQEKLHSIDLLSNALSNLRDVFYLYLGKISGEQFSRIAIWEIPFLYPNRDRLFMPEADRVVAEALIRSVFNEKDGTPDLEKFTQTFAKIQSKDAPLEQFGAARRWRMIAAIHGSLDACIIGTKEKPARLQLIYDDWWRRWRVKAYEDILAIPTQFERTNAIRYAAVLYSIQNVAVLFDVRNRLVAEVNGTAIAAGLCAYNRTFNAFPDQSEKTYGQTARKLSDIDPYDKELKPFRYLLTDKKQAINVPGGQPRWVEAGQGILWSLGQDHSNNQAAQHSDDGAVGDIVIWPPIKSLSRAQGPTP